MSRSVCRLFRCSFAEFSSAETVAAFSAGAPGPATAAAGPGVAPGAVAGPVAGLELPVPFAAAPAAESSPTTLTPFVFGMFSSFQTCVALAWSFFCSRARRAASTTGSACDCCVDCSCPATPPSGITSSIPSPHSAIFMTISPLHRQLATHSSYPLCAPLGDSHPPPHPKRHPAFLQSSRRALLCWAWIG